MNNWDERPDYTVARTLYEQLRVFRGRRLALPSRDLRDVDGSIEATLRRLAREHHRAAKARER